MRYGRSVLLTACVVLTLIIGGISVPACWSQETYKIGGIFSITGRASFLGDPEKKSLEMVVDEINKNGGIDGHPLEAVIYDSEGDPTKAVLAANKLISKDGVLAVIGPSLTPTTLAIIPIFEKTQIPLISCAAGIKITEPVKPYVFKTAQSDMLAVRTVYTHMQSKGIKTVGILTVEDAFGASGREQLLKQAPEFGIEVVQAETFGGKDTDMTAQLTKIRAVEPNAIICWGTNPGPAVVAKNVQQMKLDIPLYQSHGVASPKFIELAGDAANGNLLPTGKILIAQQLPGSDPQKQVLLDYINQFEKLYSMPVSGFGGYAYDAMHILARALEGSGGERDKIREGVEKVSGFTGVTGTFNFTPEDHNGLGSDAFVMVNIENGQWKLLDE